MNHTIRLIRFPLLMVHFICYQSHQDANLVGVKPNMLLVDRQSKNDQGKQSMSLIVVVLLRPTFTSCRHFASRLPGGYMKCEAKVHDVLGSIISGKQTRNLPASSASVLPFFCMNCHLQDT